MMLEILEGSKAMTILVTLYDSNKALSFTELVHKVKGSNGIINTRLVELREAKLVVEEIEHKFQGRRLISLTKNGLMVAELLAKVAKMEIKE
jgi:DNA-binding HxlR family transcriptional regulator